MKKIVLILAAGVTFCALGMEGQLPDSMNASHDLPSESNRFIQSLLAVSVSPMELDNKTELSAYDQSCAGVEKPDYKRRNNNLARKLFNECPNIKEQRAAAIKRIRSEKQDSYGAQMPFIFRDSEESTGEANIAFRESVAGMGLRLRKMNLDAKQSFIRPVKRSKRSFDDEFNNDDSAIN